MRDRGMCEFFLNKAQNLLRKMRDLPGQIKIKIRHPILGRVLITKINKNKI